MSVFLDLNFPYWIRNKCIITVRIVRNSRLLFSGLVVLIKMVRLVTFFTDGKVDIS